MPTASTSTATCTRPLPLAALCVRTSRRATASGWLSRSPLKGRINLRLRFLLCFLGPTAPTRTGQRLRLAPETATTSRNRRSTRSAVLSLSSLSSTTRPRMTRPRNDVLGAPAAPGSASRSASASSNVSSEPVALWNRSPFYTFLA